MLNRQRKKPNTNASSKNSPRKKLNTKAYGKIIKKDKTTQMHELNIYKKNGCPNQASKQLKQNSQMERTVKMMKKGQGERGMGTNPLLPPNRKPHMVTNCL